MQEIKEQLKKIDITLNKESKLKEFYIAIELYYDDYYRKIENNYKNYGKYSGKINNHIIDIQKIDFEVDEKATKRNETLKLEPVLRTKENKIVLATLDKIKPFVLEGILNEEDYPDDDYYDDVFEAYSALEYEKAIEYIKYGLTKDKKVYVETNINNKKRYFIPTKLYTDTLELSGYYSYYAIIEFKEVGKKEIIDSIK